MSGKIFEEVQSQAVKALLRRVVFSLSPIVKTLPPETNQRASGGTDVGRQMLERMRESDIPEGETDLFHRLTKCRLKNSIAFGHERAAACGL